MLRSHALPRRRNPARKRRVARFAGRFEFGVDHITLVSEGIQRVYFVALPTAPACVWLAGEPFGGVFVEMIMRAGDAAFGSGMKAQRTRRVVALGATHLSDGVSRDRGPGIGAREIGR